MRDSKILERDVQIVAAFVDLVHSRRRENFRRAAHMCDQLRQLGVLVRFGRPKKSQEVLCPTE